MKKQLSLLCLLLAIGLFTNAQITNQNGNQAADTNGNVLNGNLTLNSNNVFSFGQNSMLSPDQGGSIRLAGNNSAHRPYIDFYNNYNPNNIGARFILQNENSLALLFANLGIGVNNPNAKLQIASANGNTFSLKIGRLDTQNFWNVNHAGNDFRIFNGASSGSDFIFGVDSSGNSANNNVGIGTANFTQNNSNSKLLVNGKILCEEVEVIQDVLPDYVFQKYYTGSSTLKANYTMPTLEEVEAFTKENHHLPEIPSAAEVKEEGLQLKEMTTLLLQKIEELTLYTIEQEKRIKALEAKLAEKP